MQAFKRAALNEINTKHNPRAPYISLALIYGPHRRRTNGLMENRMGYCIIINNL